MGIFCDRLKFGSTAALNCHTGKNKKWIHISKKSSYCTLIFSSIFIALCMILGIFLEFLELTRQDWQDNIRMHNDIFWTYMMALQQQLFQRISPTAVILCKINDRFLWNMLRLILLNQASYSQSFSLGMFVTNKNVDVLLCGNLSNQSQSTLKEGACSLFFLS